MPDRMLGGQTTNVLKNNVFSATSQLVLQVVYDFYNRDADNANFFASNNMAVPARLFSKLDGFDLRFRGAA